LSHPRPQQRPPRQRQRALPQHLGVTGGDEVAGAPRAHELARGADVVGNDWQPRCHRLERVGSAAVIASAGDYEIARTQRQRERHVARIHDAQSLVGERRWRTVAVPQRHGCVAVKPELRPCLCARDGHEGRRLRRPPDSPPAVGIRHPHAAPPAARHHGERDLRRRDANPHAGTPQRRHELATDRIQR
jgi:hypothetical protein